MRAISFKAGKGEVTVHFMHIYILSMLIFLPWHAILILEEVVAVSVLSNISDTEACSCWSDIQLSRQQNYIVGCSVLSLKYTQYFKYLSTTS